MWYLYSANDELKHYGVLGMKWGVRRNPSKAYMKSLRKSDKLATKEARFENKAAKYERKSSKKAAYARSEKAERKAKKLQYKANKQKLKASRMKRRGEKWSIEMRKTFSSYNIERVPGETKRVGTGFTSSRMDVYKVTPMSDLKD